MNFHMDRNKDSFNAYKTLYKGMPWELFDFENLGNDANGYFVRLKKKEQLEKEGKEYPDKYKYMVEKYGDKLCLSGDADFGMKRNNTFNKDTYAYKKAEEYFSPNSPEDLMHSISNFSLMVVNGGMNCKKGFKKYRDIFPLFLCSVDKYYKIKDKDEKKEYIKKELGQIAAGGRPPKGMTKVEHDKSIEERYNKFDKIDVHALMCYLDTFEGFDDYCKRTYFFGEDSEEIKNLLDEIKDYGKNVTDKSFYECENIKKYCDLAKRYWKIREGIMDNKQANEKSQ